MNEILLSPAFYADIMSGVLILYIFTIIYISYSDIVRLTPYKNIIVLLLFSIIINLHGFSHLGLEYVYNYNPIHYYKDILTKK
jgi:hypothetical protein